MGKLNYRHISLACQCIMQEREVDRLDADTENAILHYLICRVDKGLEMMDTLGVLCEDEAIGIRGGTIVVASRDFDSLSEEEFVLLEDVINQHI